MPAVGALGLSWILDYGGSKLGRNAVRWTRSSTSQMVSGGLSDPVTIGGRRAVNILAN